MRKENIQQLRTWDNLVRMLLLLAAIIMATNVSAATTIVDATLEHTGSTYYRNDNVLHNSIDAEKEYYNNAGGQNGWNGQALMKFTFNVPENKTIVKATLTWSTIIYGSNTNERDNELWCLTTGNDIDWAALSAGTCGMVSALHESKRVKLSNTPLSGKTEHLNNVSSVMVTIALQQAERQGYIVFYLTGNQAAADLYGKASSHAPTLRLELADKRTVTFNAGDNATCATTSLTSIAEESTYTAVTLPEATDNDGAEFMGWYTAPMGGTRIGGAGDTYTPSADITLYAQYNRMPTGITISGTSTIKYGATTTLTATLSPSNTINSGITWLSGDNEVATVEPNGVVTATGLGSVYITARATANPENIRDVFQLTVESDHYAYTVNAVDGSGNILKELETGTYATGTQFNAFIPKYVLVGNTLYETAHVTEGNYYTIYETPTTDGYVINRPYTNATVSNVLYYTEAEDCSAFTKSYRGIPNRTSKGTLAHNDYTYKDVITLAPGTYRIYAEGSNGNATTRRCDFKVGDNVVFALNITSGNNRSGNSEWFTITENKVLSVRCEGSSTSGLDYFYIVQEPVYHVTTHGQKLELNKATIDATIYTTCNPISSDGNNSGTRNGVSGPFYNIKNKGNYVTVTADGAIAFSVDAFHGNDKDTRKMHIYVDDVEILAVSVDPGEYATSPIIATGGTGQHTIKITGDGKDVYLADIVFYTEKTVPKMNPSDVTVKVGETKQFHLTLPEGCILNSMTSSGDASKVTATFVRDEETQRKGELTLTGLQVTGNTPTSVTFSITAGANTIYNSGTATIEIDVMKAGLNLAYSDGDASDDATMYVCNADETTPSLPSITLTATDEQGNIVPLSNLTLSYTSDDPTVATVTNNGNISLVHPYGNGTARIKARSTGNASYDDAEAEYSITIQRGVNWKIAEHPTFKDAPPAVRDTFHVYKNVGGAEKLYLIGTFGGWNRNNNTYNYPKTDGTTTPKTDNWYGNDTKNKKMTTSSSGVDGFSKYRSGGQDASNESMYSSLKQYYNDVIYGVERFGWFKQPDNGESHPFTLPVRGAYVTLEPAVNGTLSVYIEQNGPWNTEKDDIYDNDGNWISQVNGKAVKFPGYAPYQYRPHAFFIVDQNGNLVEKYTPVNIVTRTAVNGGISTGSSSADPAAALEAFCDAYGCEKGERFKCILDETADGYNDATNVGNWKEFKEYMSAEEQQRVHDNWSAGVNGAQVITKLDNGAYLALHGGMVKYTFHVIAGQTYYIFSNFSKIGFAGVNFVPDEEAQPSGTLALSETVAYEPSALKAAEGANAVPMYETITLDRAFTAGNWNTICLPFTMTEREVEQVFGEGTELIILDRVTVDEGHAQIFMTYHEIQSILAGYPYLIKPTQNVDHIEVSNKAIDPAQQVLEFSNNGYTSKGVAGFCNPQTFSRALTGMSSDVIASTYLTEGDIYLSNNTLYISRGKSFLKGYRSYLRKEPGAAGAKTVGFGYFNAWDDEEDITHISVAELADEARQSLGISPQAGVYNMAGQKVSDTVEGLPSGIYITNGKKLVVE
jgi:hypothetical protein